MRVSNNVQEAQVRPYLPSTSDLRESKGTLSTRSKEDNVFSLSLSLSLSLSHTHTHTLSLSLSHSLSLSLSLSHTHTHMRMMAQEEVNRLRRVLKLRKQV